MSDFFAHVASLYSVVFCFKMIIFVVLYVWNKCIFPVAGPVTKHMTATGKHLSKYHARQHRNSYL